MDYFTRLASFVGSSGNATEVSMVETVIASD